MAVGNKYLEHAIENFYRREAMHVAIHTYITLYRKLYPSVTLEETAKAFAIDYKIDESLFSQDSIIAVYYRANKDLIDLHKHNKNNTKAFPIKT